MPAKQSVRKRTVGLVVFYCIAIPALLFLGLFVFGARKYYFLSICVAILAVLPTFILYDAKKPSARSVVLLAILSALIVVSRAVFFMVPQFKPMMALVIICGTAFGARAGFLVGAMSAFCSNFFFGQGPWTPFQMVSFGIVGFLAGLFFYQKFTAKNKIKLCAFGGIATYVVYGGIMNYYSVVAFMPQMTLSAFLLSYGTAIPFDLIHAGATVLFLYLLANPMLKKIERLKTKYGITFE